MCPLRLGHAYLAPSTDPFGCLGKAGHATSDFACSDGHVRVRLLTRAGSSMYLEIVLGSYIAIAVLGRSPHAGRACVGRRSGTRDHRFTCQRTQTTRAGEGSQMVTTSPLPSRGCSALGSQKSADLDYWGVVTPLRRTGLTHERPLRVFPEPLESNARRLRQVVHIKPAGLLGPERLRAARRGGAQRRLSGVGGETPQEPGLPLPPGDLAPPCGLPSDASPPLPEAVVSI